MNIERKPVLADIAAILKAQLMDTVVLGAYVQSVEARFRDENGAAPDLLRSLWLELRTLSELINRRVATCGNTATYVRDEEPLLRMGEDGSLESVLNSFCRYARRTTERLGVVRQAYDQETIQLFDRILSPTKAGALFVDLSSCSRAQMSAVTSAKVGARVDASTRGQLNRRARTAAHLRTGVIHGNDKQIEEPQKRQLHSCLGLLNFNVVTQARLSCS
jgi:hypothetical protein